MVKPEIKFINHYPFLFINIDSPIIAVEAYIIKDINEIKKKDIGLDHLLEHILANSYNKCNKNCLQYFKKKGIKNNAYVTNNVINYNISGFLENINIMLDYIYNITIRPEFDKEIIAREKKIVENELLIYIDNIDYDINNIISKNLYNFNNFKFSQDYKLQIENLEFYDYKYILNYYKKNYNNIIYIISGNTENIQDKIQKIFLKNSYKNNYFIKKNIDVNIFNYTKKIIFIKNENRKSSLIVFNFIINYSFSDLKSIYLEVISNILNNLFIKILRTEKKYIYSSKIYIKKYIYGVHLSINLNTKNSNLIETINTTIQIINDIKEKKNYKEFIESSKKLFLIEYLTQKFNIYDFINFYAKQYLFLIYGYNQNIISRLQYKNIISSVKFKDIDTVINEVFNFDNCLLIYSNNKSEINKNLINI